MSNDNGENEINGRSRHQRRNGVMAAM